MVCGMKPIASPFLICLLLALAMALAGLATGRAAGIAVFEAGLTKMVICADGEGQKTVLVSRDGVPVELPHCSGMLCDDCLQAGSDAISCTPWNAGTAPTKARPVASPNSPLHHPDAVVRARSRAPPGLSKYV